MVTRACVRQVIVEFINGIRVHKQKIKKYNFNMIPLILKKIEEYEDDIPTEEVGEFFSLHNKVCDKHEWYQHSKSSRQIVLNNLKLWLADLNTITNTYVRNMTKEQKIKLWTNHNILFPEAKEVGFSCSACRQRMVKKINTLK